MRAKRFIPRLILLALLVYVLWAGWQIVRFKRYESAAAPLPASEPFPYEVEGAYHMHSRHSDGTKTVDGIAQAAARAGLKFIILTDHGRPNFASLDAQGRKAGVLVLAGSEISSNRGHLVALGFDRPDDSFAFHSDAEAAAGEIAGRGGFSVIAHPYSKVRWSWGEAFPYSGLEIIDADSMIKGHIFRSLPFYPLLLVKPTAALLNMIRPPKAALQKWDQLLANGRANGYFSSDAHIFYGAIFPVFHLHVLLDRPLDDDFAEARRQIFDALKAGRFYSAADGAAAARGFRIRLDGSSLRVSAPFSFDHETVIVHNGKAIARLATDEFIVPVHDRGAYRAEVYLKERTPLDARVPWIISNPVYY